MMKNTKSLIDQTRSLFAHVLSFQTLDVLRSTSRFPPKLRVVFQQILREKVFPEAFCEHFDREVSPYLDQENDGYLFRDTASPHRTLLSMFDDFMATLRRPYSGRNFLEIGVGAGGISYCARCLGFDVISTDAGHGKFKRAGEAAWALLSIHPIDFLVSCDNSVDSLMRFRNGQRADYIYLRGVPFNRLYVNGKPFSVPGKSFPNGCHWYGHDEWVAVLGDMFEHLNMGGNLINKSVYMLPQNLAHSIRDTMIRKYGKSCHIEYSFSSRVLNQQELEMTGIRLTRTAHHLLNS